jgi:hypothetical protein
MGYGNDMAQRIVIGRVSDKSGERVKFSLVWDRFWALDTSLESYFGVLPSGVLGLTIW